ncbi:transcription factor bHLH27-like [Aristolochia californica]|uniref:transcription factor bHLH27-like n=1 Tax=Aristolochia californica TaxID=171875 RepID=UPI0035E023EE
MKDLEGIPMEGVPDLCYQSTDLEGSLNSCLDGWLDIQLPEVDVFEFLPNAVDDESVNLNLFLSDQSNNSFEGQNVYQEHPYSHHEQQWQEEPREWQEVLFQDEKEDTVLEDEEDEAESDNRKFSGSSKNLVSERNRRKRLNQQLFTLRSLVPNITKMDKRSILVDALAYLQSILQQTKMEMEMEMIDRDMNSSGEKSAVVMEESPPAQYRECVRPAMLTISQIDAEMLGEDRFMLKVISNKAIGALGQVQKVIESLGFEITLVSVNELDQDHCLTMTFLRAKKKGVVTNEKLKYRVKVLATKMGFHISEL